MRITRRLALAMAASIAGSSALAQAGMAERRFSALARGFNLPDLVPRKRGMKISVPQLKALHAAGMTHIRLPAAGENFMPHFSGAATIAYAISELDEALDALLGLGFAVTVDMHPGREFARLLRSDRAKAMSELYAAWMRLAPRLRKRDAAKVFTELLNEPSTEDAFWRPAAEALVNRLRDHLPDSVMIAGPAPFQRVEALAAWEPFADRNVAYAFHYYDPMAFTHQGQTWAVNDPLSRLAYFPYPSGDSDPRIASILAKLREVGDAALIEKVSEASQQAWNRAAIDAQFETLRVWRDRHDVHVVMNEFGALRFKSGRSDRLRWIRDVREAAEKAGFGWTHWDYNGGFGLIAENGSIDREVLSALTGKASRRPSSG